MVVVIKHFVCTMCTNIVVIQRSLKNHLRWFRLFTAAYAFLWHRPLRSQLVAPRKVLLIPAVLIDASFGDGFTMFQQILATSCHILTNVPRYLWILLNQPSITLVADLLFAFIQGLLPYLAPVERKESRRNIRALQGTRLPGISQNIQRIKGKKQLNNLSNE